MKPPATRTSASLFKVAAFEKAKVSVVTPSFNQLAYLRLCVASVADQTGVEVEHIVQDGGSHGKVSLLLKDKPSVRLFVEADTGMYDAINRGLRRACGDICGYLNCDEQYLPGALAKVAAFFNASQEIDVVFGDIILVDLTGRPLSYRRSILPTKDHVQLAHLNTASCATFFRHRLIERGFFFDTKWKAIGDAVWIAQLLSNGVKMATIREPLAVFTMTGENLGASQSSRSEAIAWRNGTNVRRRVRFFFEILLHRVRKALAGAYKLRNVEIQVYTPDSPEQRQTRFGRRIGFSWPRGTT